MDGLIDGTCFNYMYKCQAISVGSSLVGIYYDQIPTWNSL